MALQNIDIDDDGLQRLVKRQPSSWWTTKYYLWYPRIYVSTDVRNAAEHW